MATSLKKIFPRLGPAIISSIDKAFLKREKKNTEEELYKSQQKLEKALRASEEKYRHIFENVQDVYYETSIEGTILNLSPSISLMSKAQYNQADLLGKSMYDFYSDPEERQLIISALKETGSVPDFEIRL